MRVLHERCCGLDIHKRFVVACLLTTRSDGTVHKEVRTYSAMTTDLLALADWLRGEDCGPVVMESTGSYWRPVFNLLEEQCEVLVVNAYHAKAVPGRKTDVKDGQGCRVAGGSAAPRTAARQLHPGACSASPARPHALSHPPRRRASAAHQPAASGPRGCQSVKLASVVTDVRGLSAREILQRLLEGETDAQALAELARGKLRAKRDALAQAVVGRLEAHHVFLLREQLAHLIWTTWTRPSRGWTPSSTERLAAEQEAIALLETIPGVARRTAEVLARRRDRHGPLALPSAPSTGLLGGDVPGQCGEWRPTPQRPDTPRQRLGAAHAG